MFFVVWVMFRFGLYFGPDYCLDWFIMWFGCVLWFGWLWDLCIVLLLVFLLLLVCDVPNSLLVCVWCVCVCCWCVCVLYVLVSVMFAFLCLLFFVLFLVLCVVLGYVCVVFGLSFVLGLVCCSFFASRDDTLTVVIWATGREREGWGGGRRRGGIAEDRGAQETAIRQATCVG